MLQHMYDDTLTPPALAMGPAGAPGRVFWIDQNLYLPAEAGAYGGLRGIGMAKWALAYVPTGCQLDIASCALHVHYHGCRGGTNVKAHDAYVAGTGLNAWGEANNIVMLYPQAHANPLNQQGCWDWTGFVNNMFDTYEGLQLRTVSSMMAGLAACFNSGCMQPEQPAEQMAALAHNMSAAMLVQNGTQ